MNNCVTGLVIGRLGDIGADTSPSGLHERRRESSSYGMLRLGLVPSAIGEPEPEEADASAKPVFRKCTFKLPCDLAERLRGHSVSSRKYQYLLATEAIRAFLEGPGEGLALAAAEPAHQRRESAVEPAPSPGAGEPVRASEPAPSAAEAMPEPSEPEPREQPAPPNEDSGPFLRRLLDPVRWTGRLWRGRPKEPDEHTP